ncbi:hypothetical protein [Nitrosovibrio sp. Nv17]|jgi:hypothetical protein|uniref:hypothetical protein n=1 Tax=Nitrosovibrio sp. Nv17 TaxID=1855339 RepID=UPI00090871A1|nr:hypothetical protein [Nitrosovibrio sp. Nv17]SFW21828.1 hypothetical protein SAMN05216414_106111 [Nitrosovibrio sp. Nv17]
MTDMEKPIKIERRRGPSTSTLSFGGVIAIISLLASGVATYNAVQNDIASLKRGEHYQERVNEHLTEEIRSIRIEQREAAKELNEKLDRIIEQWPRGKRQ